MYIKCYAAVTSGEYFARLGFVELEYMAEVFNVEEKHGSPVFYYRLRNFTPKPRVIPETDFRNGMVVRMPNHLGDALMALPALLQLKKIMPECCALGVIIPREQYALYASIAEVDGIFTLDRAHTFFSREMLHELFITKFGVAVLFNNSLRDVISLRMTLIPRIYGAAARCRSWLLTSTVGVPPRSREPKYSGEHLTNRYLAIASDLGAPEWKGELPKIKMISQPEERSIELAATCAHPLLMVMAPGAAFGVAKRWSTIGFNAVAKFWTERGGLVALTGTNEERNLCDEVMNGVKPNRIYNFAGKTRLLDLMLLVNYSKIVVSNDSGTMHLGAIMNKPGVAMFGSTDYTATGPVSGKWSCLCARSGCTPCFAHACPNGKAPLCLKSILPEMVIDAVSRQCEINRIPIGQ